MARQVESLTWEEFLEIYKTILGQLNMLPTVQIEKFVKSIGEIASRNSEVENAMIQGAQSIKRWVGERDAEAPIDLIGAALRGKKC